LPPVTCHIGELNQVFLNIIVNAAHAIEGVVGEGERGTIRIRTWTDGSDAKISISDTGGGIPEHVRDKIFDPFFTTKEVGKGTGQGLAIARSVVVDKHGGRIDVVSETGRGTTFTITVPIEGNAQPLAA
jgi:signal transduction histidine kinase